MAATTLIEACGLEEVVTAQQEEMVTARQENLLPTMEACTLEGVLLAAVEATAHITPWRKGRSGCAKKKELEIAVIDDSSDEEKDIHAEQVPSQEKKRSAEVASVSTEEDEKARIRTAPLERFGKDVMKWDEWGKKKLADSTYEACLYMAWVDNKATIVNEEAKNGFCLRKVNRYICIYMYFVFFSSYDYSRSRNWNLPTMEYSTPFQVQDNNSLITTRPRDSRLSHSVSLKYKAKIRLCCRLVIGPLYPGRRKVKNNVILFK